MPLKFILDSLDGLDEVTAALYTKTGDGKFRLAVDGAESSDEVAGLKRSQQEILDERKKLQDKLAKLEGIDPTKYKEMVDAEAKAEQDGLEKKGEWDKLKEQLVGKHNEAVAEKDKTITGLRGRLSETEIDNEARKILADKEVRGNAELLMPHIRRRAKLNDETETVEIFQADGVTPMLGGTQGKPAELKDLIAEMRADKMFGGAFEGNKATGTGAKGEETTGEGVGEGEVPAGDNQAFLDNVDAIAAGKVTVVEAA